MKPTCGQCKRWQRHMDVVTGSTTLGYSLGLGICTDMSLLGESIIDLPDGAGKSLSANVSNVGSFIATEEFLHANLLTRPGFGCSEFINKDPSAGTSDLDVPSEPQPVAVISGYKYSDKSGYLVDRLPVPETNWSGYPESRLAIGTLLFTNP